MADYYTRRKSILEEADLDKLQGSDEIFLELINPFDVAKLYHFAEPYLFKNEQWIFAELRNDYFVETHNFTILTKLMGLSNEDHCLISHAYPSNPSTYYKLYLTTDIDRLRQLMDDDMERYADWAFLSISKVWSALSFYDGDSLIIGCQQNLKANLEELVRSNPDFVRFL